MNDRLCLELFFVIIVCFSVLLFQFVPILKKNKRIKIIYSIVLVMFFVGSILPIYNTR